MKRRNHQHSRSTLPTPPTPLRASGAALIAALGCLALLSAPTAPGAQQEMPTGYTEVAGRSALTAIDEPTFVAAGAARMQPEARVLGVVIGEQARAYDLDLLADHEVVNDTIDGTDFVVAWSPYANAAAIFSREIDGRSLEFEPAAGLLHGSLVLRDRQTGSYWSMISGRAEAGPLAGTALPLLPVSDRMQWAEWHARHPRTRVLSVAGDGNDPGAPATQDPGTDPLAAYFASDEGHDGIEARDPRMDTKDPVYAFVHDGVPYSVDTRRVVGGNAFTLNDGSQALVYREAGDGLDRASAAFLSRAGFEQRGGSWFEVATDAEFNAITRDFGGAGIPRLPGFDTFWYTWSLVHPDTELLR